MDVIDKFMNLWEEKAIAHYNILNKQYLELKKTHKQEYDKYKKEHRLSKYYPIPSKVSLKQYDERIKFLRNNVGNIAIEMLMGYNYSGQKFQQELKKIIKKESERKKKNLLNRIQSKTGEIVTASLKIGGNNELNGTIVGRKGKVEVETIYAGGYNIQCLHFRVLIKEQKKVN